MTKMPVAWLSNSELLPYILPYPILYLTVSLQTNFNRSFWNDDDFTVPQVSMWSWWMYEATLWNRVSPLVLLAVHCLLWLAVALHWLPGSASIWTWDGLHAKHMTYHRGTTTGHPRHFRVSHMKKTWPLIFRGAAWLVGQGENVLEAKADQDV